MKSDGVIEFYIEGVSRDDIWFLNDEDNAKELRERPIECILKGLTCNKFLVLASPIEQVKKLNIMQV